MKRLVFRTGVLNAYPDVFTPSALQALEVLAPLNEDRREMMNRRIANRLMRQRNRERIGFLDPTQLIPRTTITVQNARDGKFDGSEIPVAPLYDYEQTAQPMRRRNEKGPSVGERVSGLVGRMRPGRGSGRGGPR